MRIIVNFIKRTWHALVIWVRRKRTGTAFTKAEMDELRKIAADREPPTNFANSRLSVPLGYSTDSKDQ